MYPIQAIKDAHPIEAYLRRAGHSISETNGKLSCCCPFHDDKHPSLTIRPDKQDWKCWVCNIGGSVLDLHMRMKGYPKVKDAIKDLAESAGIQDDHQGKKHVADTYDYRDKDGKLLMKVDRIEQVLEKQFAQYVETPTGRVNTIKDVKKVLFRYEQWADKDEVHLCEGEKCVKALESIGMDATSNAGGASAWVPAYAFYLENKHVNIWPDNDSAGGKWLTGVMESLKGKVLSFRVLKTPPPYNDVADILLLQGLEMGEETIRRIMGDTRRITRGIEVPIMAASEMYDLYIKRVTASKDTGINLAKWLPAFGPAIRPLLPGDLAVLLSDTGVGKTCILANVAFSQNPKPVLFFELELTAEDMCERFLQLDLQKNGRQLETDVIAGKRHTTTRWGNVYTCSNSKVTIDDMEDIISKAELVIGCKPALVLIDYIGLISGKDNKRYERMSNIAEGLKVMAKNTGTVVMLSSQIHRDKERKDISLHDAKDSGSIEASAQLVLGAWRPSIDRINIKLLKCTKSAIGLTIECSFDGDRQSIRQIHQ